MSLEFEVRIPKSNFAAGAAQNAGLDVDFVLPATTRGTRGNARNLVKSITIVAQDNHSFDLWAYSTASRNLAGAASSDNTKFLGRWQFAAANAVQRTDDANSFWHYYVDGNDLPLRDDDAATDGNGGNTGKLHLTLIDRTGALPASHNLTIEMRLQPVQYP